MIGLLSAVFLVAAVCHVWIALRGYSQLGRTQKFSLLGLRLAVLGLVLLAIYAPTINRQLEDKVCNVLVVDVSKSTCPRDGTQQVPMPKWVREVLGAKGEDDRAPVVVFGRNNVVAHGAGADGGDLDIAQVTRDRTCISQALRAASGQFVEGYTNRITLVSDGWEEIGNAMATAARLRVPIDVVPLRSPQDGVRIQGMEVPAEVKVGQPCEVQIRLDGNLKTGGELTLMVDGKLSEKKSVPAGTEGLVTFSPAIMEEGTHLLAAMLQVAGDDDTSDNAAQALVEVRGKIEVLVVDQVPAEIAPAVKALEEAGMKVTVADKAGFAAQKKELQRFDVVVLSDIAFEDIGREGASRLRAYTRDGGGLVMAGGPRSFGAGGYYKTDVEESLPVYMDPYREPVTQAVAIILDKSWSMGDMAASNASKIDLIREAAIATVAGLKDKDYLAVLSFDSAAHVIRPMQKIEGDKQQIVNTIATLGSFGLTDWYPAMSIASDMFAGIPKANRNVVLLSDGRPSAGVRDYRGIIAEKLLKQDIKFSAIGCGKDVNERLLKDLVDVGRGKYYRIADAKGVPKVNFEPDRKDPASGELLLVELPLKPKVAVRDRSLQDVRFDRAPELLGYNRARPKDLAQVNLLISAKDEPLLARWHYGAGRGVAFLSDLKGRWAARWITAWSDGYRELLCRTVLWAASSIDECRIALRHGEDKTSVEVEVLDPDVLGSQGIQGSLVYSNRDGRSEYANIAPKTVDFRRVGVDAYRARIDEPSQPYLLRVRAGGAEEGKTMGALSRPKIAGESHLGQANTVLLKGLAAISGGKYDPAPAETLRRGKIDRVLDLGPWLLLAAAFLFFLEVAVKRAKALERLVVRDRT